MDTWFVRPTDPWIFIPTNPPGTVTRGGGLYQLTLANITTQQNNHDELKRQYNEVQAVETALRKQIIDAIEDVYLQPLRDSSTDMIQCDISAIFDFLRSTYGRLSPTQLKAKENEIDSIIYDPSCNVDAVFNKTQDFQYLCIILNNDKTDTQLVTYAYLIL